MMPCAAEKEVIVIANQFLCPSKMIMIEAPAMTNKRMPRTSAKVSPIY